MQETQIGVGRNVRAAIPAVYVVIGLLLAPSLLWIVRDQRVWMWDQSSYGAASVNLWFSLTHSLPGWIRAMLGELNSKPPGIAWFGEFFVPLHTLMGSVEASLLFSILVTQAAVLLLTFGIGRALSSGSYIIPTAGVIFAASSQLFIGLSHQYFVEPLQCVAVSWVLLIVAKVDGWPNTRVAVHLIAALILGALAKTTTPLYCIAPCFYIAGMMLHTRGHWAFSAEWKNPLSRALILLSGIFGVAGAAWYARNRVDVWRHIRDASSGTIAQRYGFSGSITAKFGAWARLLEQSLCAPYLIWVLVLAGFAAVVLLHFRDARDWPMPGSSDRRLVVLSAVQIVVLLCVFSFSDAGDARFVYAFLPYTAVVVMWLCAFTGSRRAVAVLCALFASQWAVLHGVALGAISHVPNQSPWLLSVQGDKSNSEELESVVRATAVAGKYDIFAVSEWWLNATSADFYAAKQRLYGGPDGSYLPLGYGEMDFESALKFIDAVAPRYVITLDQDFQQTPPDFVNVISLPILRELRRREYQYKSVPFKSDKGILIFERLDSPSPWTILSTVFPQALARTNSIGESWWTIHPSWRRHGPPTRLLYDAPLPPHAVFSAYIEHCQQACPGVEVVLNVSGSPGEQATLRLPGPLEGKRLHAAFENSTGRQLTVEIHSIDPERDVIDGCWLTIRGIQVTSR